MSAITFRYFILSKYVCTRSGVVLWFSSNVCSLCSLTTTTPRWPVTALCFERSTVSFYFPVSYMQFVSYYHYFQILLKTNKPTFSVFLNWMEIVLWKSCWQAKKGKTFIKNTQGAPAFWLWIDVDLTACSKILKTWNFSSLLKAEMMLLPVILWNWTLHEWHQLPLNFTWVLLSYLVNVLLSKCP